MDSFEKLSQLLGAIDAVAAEAPVIFPVHPRTQQRIAQTGVRHHPQLRMILPIGYLDFLCLLTALGVPCLNLRENTERPVTISDGTNLLMGTDPDKILAAARDVLAGKWKVGRIPALWDGHAAMRIVANLLRLVPRQKAP